ncbi:MAG: DNA-3-methyladenine glycosylase 2 family protein [Pseudobutyrivibrio sp.]|nr:DNA-3-methyladenine glycosylase 2 family protein [Pseudobutyrivibrio sp.]
MPDVVTLNMETPSIQYLCKKDKRLEKVISMVGTITYTTHDNNPYAFLIHEIIEQMLSIKVGATIYNRLVDLCDGNLTPEAINSLSIEQIRSTGTSFTKASYIKGITENVLSGNLVFDDLMEMSDEAVSKKLLSLRGIGQWTAKMYLLFVLDRPDILPYEDVAFLQSYEWMYNSKDKSKESVIKKCAKWKPYSSIASRYLYRALDTGLTKEEFHLYK